MAVRKVSDQTATGAPEDFPLGSDPEIPVIPPLAVPDARAIRVRFGDTPVIVERHDDTVALVFPGGVRIEGSTAEAVALATALSVRPPHR